MIDKLQDNMLLKRGVHYSVYGNYCEGDSLQDLLCNVFAKINEMICDVNAYTECIKKTIDWIRNNGVEEAVKKELDDMLESGKFNDIISNTIFLDLRNAIEENKNNIEKVNEKVDTEIKNFNEKLDNKLDEFNEKVDTNLSNFKKLIDEINKEVEKFNAKMLEIQKENSDKNMEQDTDIKNNTSNINILNSFDLRKIQPVPHGYVMVKKTRVSQGLGINDMNMKIYATRVYSDDEGKAQSYMISEFDETGKETGNMICKNGGHGTNFGVEYVKNGNEYDTYIWSAWERTDSNDVGIGDVVVRYKFKGDGREISLSSPDVKIINTGSNIYSIPCCDTQNDVICLTRKINGKYNPEFYKLSDLKNGIITKLGMVKLNKMCEESLQGYCFSGDILYWRIGDASSEPDMTYVYDWKNNKELYNIYTGINRPINNNDTEQENFREPEGCCIYTNPLNNMKSYLIMTVIGGQGRRKHIIHGYHQLSNAGLFALRECSNGQKFALTKPDGQAKDFPNNLNSLTQFRDYGCYFLSSDEYNRLSDRPDKEAKDSSWYLEIGARRNSWDDTVLQTMTRNNAGHLDKYFRFARDKNNDTPWQKI